MNQNRDLPQYVRGGNDTQTKRYDADIAMAGRLSADPGASLFGFTIAADTDGCACGGYEKSCRRRGFGIKDGVLAALYIPLQGFEGLYDLDTALARGTLFRALDKPFSGNGKEGGCRGQQR